MGSLFDLPATERQQPAIIELHRRGALLG